MAFCRKWFLILTVLVLGSGVSLAAGSKKEERAYAAAVGAFQDGMWNRAETAFAQFVENYPASSHVAEAVLLQAQAEFKQGKLAAAIARLTDTNNLAKAGSLAGEYFYRTGEAQFQGEYYSDAAKTWIALAQKFPESRLRLRAVVEAAAAFTKLTKPAGWRQVVGLLEETNGVFQRAVQKNPSDEQITRGELLLAQAKFELKDFDGASAVLEPLLDSKTLNWDLGRQCGLLLYQVKLAADDTDAALAVTTNLLQIARLEKNNDWTAEGVALQAHALEKLGRVTEAIAVYQENLTNAPVERQREAVLKIAGLAVAEKQFSVATNALEKFLAQFPDSPAADTVLLTLGELHLKDYVASLDTASTMNQLAEAQQRFDQFIVTFTNSPLAGRAYLDRGWCLWLAENFSGSYDDFKTAAQKIAALRLPPSEDLLVAWFKMGDAQFKQKDFAGALENYHAVLDSLNIYPDAGATLGDPALYQILRASVEMNDAAGASNAFAQIFLKHPDDALAQSSSLLYGESLASPADARALFEKLLAQLSGLPLQPQVALALSRTYERERNWPAAVTNYENWLKNFPANALQPQVGYAMAQAAFQAGNETDAFRMFTNFVAQFPTNELAPVAQWWVADHFYRAGDFVNAERSYKSVFQNTNWLGSHLVYEAQMMAGRSAVGRLGYSDAIGYFKGLAGDTNCPPKLDVQARFAWGSALMLSDSTDTNNPLANYQSATNVFGRIYQSYPTNEWGVLALGELADCYFQLANYDAATNAYGQIFNSSLANISARSQAQIGLGSALEKKAALAAAGEQAALLNQALDDYLFVFDGQNLRDGEQSDSWWVKKAGLQGAPLVGMLNDPEAEKLFYKRLERMLPQLTDSIEKKIAALPPGKN
jgi:TolA-binding protein